jgi:predicted phosphodiesterase
MPFHNYEYLKKSNLSVLEATGKIIILNKLKGVKVENSDIILNIVGCHWKEEIKEAPLKKANEYNILVMHTMISLNKIEKSKVFTSIKALDLLVKCKGYDLILSGHNHNSFVEKNGRSILVNPGSITRTAINQIDHQPCLYLWYAKEREVEKIIIPCESFGSILNEEYMISNFVEKNELYSFIINLKKTGLITSFSFQDNLDEFMEINKVKKEVKEIVLASLN